MILRTFCLILLLFSTNCRMFKAMAKGPMTAWTKITPPDGTPAFQAGFRDGCQQMLYARGNGFYRWRYKYRYNPRMKGNQQYRAGQRRGASTCFNFVTPGVYSPDRYIFRHKIAAGFMAKDYNSATGGLFGGLDSPIPKAASGGLNGVFQVWGGSGSDSVFGANVLWAGGSKGQFFGQ